MQARLFSFSSSSALTKNILFFISLLQAQKGLCTGPYKSLIFSSFHLAGIRLHHTHTEKQSVEVENEHENVNVLSAQ